MQFRFYAVPPAFRFFIAMGWRRLMFAAYGAHKALVLWREWACMNLNAPCVIQGQA